jgi:chloramphenicol 3-O-phosphotransferase
VYCSILELRRREARRPDRVPGWAEQQVPILYQGQEFDLEIDTSEASAEEAARRVIRHVFGP